MNEVIRALFVAWQNPATRRFYPVGRLAQIDTPDHQGCFEFVYLQGVLEADGFEPFISFPNLHRIYQSHELFPMFDNRVVSRKRSDFSSHIAELGLPEGTVNPITILSRSSGRRMTDTLQLFPLPEFEPEIGYRTWFWAHGIRHLANPPEERIASLVPEEQVFVQPDPTNPVVPNALALWTRDDICIGYMPSYILEDIATLNGLNTLCRIFVERVNPPPAPIQQRILLRMESSWPQQFVPYSTARYQPLPAGAAGRRLPLADHQSPSCPTPFNGVQIH